MTDASLVLALAAFVVAALSLLWTILNSREVKRASALSGNLSTMVSVESSIAQTPSVLRFHGITDDDLERHRVTGEELAYLVASFTAGGIWHRLGGYVGKVFPKDHYRYRMLQSTDTRRVWPLLNRMTSASHYKKKIERTINHIERKETEPEVRQASPEATPIAASDKPST